MPKTQYQIKLNYDQSKAEIEKLESLARKTGLLEEDIINYHDMLKTYWDSSNAAEYLAKMDKRAEELGAISKNLYKIAEEITEIIENTYKAEQEALDIVMKHI